MSDAIYYGRLFQDPTFVARVKERWGILKSNLQTIPAFIDIEKSKLSKSAEINIQLWPISSRVNGDETMSFDDAVQRMKTAYEARLEFIDNAINNM